MRTPIARRAFLKHSTAGAASAWGATLLPASVWGKSPNEKLNLAVIGVAGRGGDNLQGVAGENVVALCDVDANNLAAAARHHPKAQTFADFRKMLPAIERAIDAVVVSTPDHTHAPAAAMAMRLGKHCYCEKPLTHSVAEARTLTELAARNKLATQLGTQIHAGSNYRRVVELVQSGAIGEVREVHVWSGASYGGKDRPKETPPVPPQLDWGLWLGPAPQRPYHPDYVPFRWRGWADFGNGGLGDFFCHFSDLVFWALKLRYPTSVEAEGPTPHPESCPEWLIVRYEFPQRDSLPPLRLTWYDGGKRPAMLRDVVRQWDHWGAGVLFVGAKGMLLSDYGRHVLLPEDKFADFQAPPKTIPESIGHHQEWIVACKTGGPTTCPFSYSGPLTEAALLGTVAFRSGEKFAWDGPRMKPINNPKAEARLARDYRQGWTL